MAGRAECLQSLCLDNVEDERCAISWGCIYASGSTKSPWPISAIMDRVLHISVLFPSESVVKDPSAMTALYHVLIFI
jgi:hypothetical protein